MVAYSTEARKRLEEDVGLPKGQAGTLAPPSPQVSDRTQPQQLHVFIMTGGRSSGRFCLGSLVLQPPTSTGNEPQPVMVAPLPVMVGIFCMACRNNPIPVMIASITGIGGMPVIL